MCDVIQHDIEYVSSTIEWLLVLCARRGPALRFPPLSYREPTNRLFFSNGAQVFHCRSKSVPTELLLSYSGMWKGVNECHCGETNTCFTPPPPPPLPKAPKWLCTVAYAALPVRVCSGAYVQFLSLLFLQHYFTTPHTFQWNYLPETWFVLDIHTKYSSSWSYLSQ